MYTYTVVWSDEFDQAGLPDADKWSFDIGHGTNGWGNAELQYYCDDPEVCRVRDGCLAITAQKTGSGRYSSARLHTYGKASWQYGRFEVRAKLPSGLGTWPAVWFLGNGIREGVAWPLCGEIDLVEHVGRMPENVHFSLHTKTFNHKAGTHLTAARTIAGVTEDFHVYRMDWTRESIAFFVDDEPCAIFEKRPEYTLEDWPFDQPFHLIINLALGGYWGGKLDESVLPAVFELDYVRVYQAVDA